MDDSDSEIEFNMNNNANENAAEGIIHQQGHLNRANEPQEHGRGDAHNFSDRDSRSPLRHRRPRREELDLSEDQSYPLPWDIS